MSEGEADNIVTLPTKGSTTPVCVNTIESVKQTVARVVRT